MCIPRVLRMSNKFRDREFHLEAVHSAVEVASSAAKDDPSIPCVPRGLVLHWWLKTAMVAQTKTTSSQSCTTIFVQFSALSFPRGGKLV